MALSKRHFEAIAAIIAANRHRSSSIELFRMGVVMDELADYFSSQNPRFDRQHFVDACTKYR
jgi:hypothetical protein